LLSVAVHPANIQDRDGIALVLSRRTRRLFPFIERIFADGGYQGPKATAAAARTGTWKIEIVKRLDTAVGFEVVPKRWIVERTIAWISRFRRLARDFERYARTIAAFMGGSRKLPGAVRSQMRKSAHPAPRRSATTASTTLELCADEPLALVVFLQNEMRAQWADPGQHLSTRKLVGKRLQRHWRFAGAAGDQARGPAIGFGDVR
jgi:transposase